MVLSSRTHYVCINHAVAATAVGVVGVRINVVAVVIDGGGGVCINIAAAVFVVVDSCINLPSLPLSCHML